MYYLFIHFFFAFYTRCLLLKCGTVKLPHPKPVPSSIHLMYTISLVQRKVWQKVVVLSCAFWKFISFIWTCYLCLICDRFLLLGLLNDNCQSSSEKFSQQGRQCLWKEKKNTCSPHKTGPPISLFKQNTILD
jgi:hypothetical protein